MLKAEKITKIFKDGEVYFEALKDIDLEIEEKEFIIITGRSGAGKSTLLYQLGLLDNPSSGKIYFNGYDTSRLSDVEKTKFRIKNMGYVFQDYALLPELTALENTLVPLLMSGVKNGQAEKIAKEALESLGLGKKFHNLPSQLSGGEQQRVSIARAIINNSKIILADEPTANLDTGNATEVINIFKKLYEKGQTIVMITHEKEFFNIASRIVFISDGKIEKISQRNR